MDRFAIVGNRRLTGTVRISGAKNSALPIIAAALLPSDQIVLENVPDVMDVRTMVKLVSHLGALVDFQHNKIVMQTPRIRRQIAPYDIVRKMRASYYVLGALIGRERQARVSLPGGCAIGPRPIDLHLKGLRALGTDIAIENGYVCAQARRLRGAKVSLLGAKGTSVGATINTMLAAVMAEGFTEITPAACEPEVVDVADFLNACGARISGAGTARITIQGGQLLTGTRYRIIPDRIETGTFAVAAAISRGQVRIENCQPAHLAAVIDILKNIGVGIKIGADHMVVTGRARLRPVDVYVAPYPGFPTDMQAQVMALLTIVPGTSTIKETIFENRFMQAMELARMGADITIEGDLAVIRGVKQLTGAWVMASDLRASASLVLAGLASRGTTFVRRIYHLDRGYERFEQKLRRLGAVIRRERE